MSWDKPFLGKLPPCDHTGIAFRIGDSILVRCCMCGQLGGHPVEDDDELKSPHGE